MSSVESEGGKSKTSLEISQHRHTQQRSSSCFLPGTIGKQLSAISKQLDTIGIISKHLGSIMDLVAILIFTGFAVGFFIIAAEDFG